MNTTNDQELISALADGELQAADFPQAVLLATRDARARADWHAYHLVGEVLRTGQAPRGSAPEAFLARLQQSLAADAKPALQAALKPIEVRPSQVARPDAAPANDRLWKLVAGVASVAAVAAIGWNVLGTAPVPQSQLAAAAPAGAVVPVAAQQMMIRDPRLDRFLAAHRQMAGGTVLQTSSGFLRNATFESAAR